MRFLKQTVTLMIFAFLIFATSAKALIPIPTSSLTQRNCSGDLSFTRDVETLNGVVCVWDKDQNDPTMSLTTHFMDPSIRFVEVHCKFTPGYPTKDNAYKSSRLTQISETRSAKITGLDINSDIAQFNLHYTGTDDNRMGLDNNANIIFYLNNAEDYSWWNPFSKKATYNDHDLITCDFKVVR